VGARLAERVTVNVGAHPDRVAWAVAAVRQTAPPDAQPSIGAYLVIAAHPDPAVARELARGPVGAYAHFPGMPGADGAPLDESDRRIVKAVAHDYDLTGHGRREGRHVAHLTDDFVDRYAVVGTPEACAGRLSALAAIGLDRLLLVEGADARLAEEQRRAHHYLVNEVLPALRAAAGRPGTPVR
jgi:5,10-methylenetetrahydromethanopterin reductase